MRRMILAIVGAAVIAALTPGIGTAKSKPFTTPVQLTGPTGGEPSIATDPFGDVFVEGPQGIPSGTNDEAGVRLLDLARRRHELCQGPGSGLVPRRWRR